MNTTTLKYVAASVLACAALAGCEREQSPPEVKYEAASAPAEAPAPPPPPSPQELAVQQRPADQVALEALLKAVTDAEQSSGNAINDEAAFNKAYHAYCTDMQKDRPLKSWTAEVNRIFAGDPKSGDDKNGHISLVTPGGLEVYEDLIENTPTFKTVQGLKEGDYVKFSLNVDNLEKGSSTPYDECHDPFYHSPRGPLVNKFLTGKGFALSPLVNPS